jgi:hypothetical protein
LFPNLLPDLRDQKSQLNVAQVRPGNVVPDKEEEADYDNPNRGSEEDGGESLVCPGNVVPCEGEEADYDDPKRGSEEDAGKSLVRPGNPTFSPT